MSAWFADIMDRILRTGQLILRIICGGRVVYAVRYAVEILDEPTPLQRNE